MQNNNDDIVDINLDIDGRVMPPKNDKIALIDADTVAYTAALNSQLEIDVLPEEFYTKEEWEEITSSHTYDKEAGTYRQANVKAGVENSEAKIQRILDKTGCKEVYLVFSGKNNFRYSLTKDLPPEKQYKANRDPKVTPAGLLEIKDALCKLYPSVVTDGYEADDLVVYLKNTYRDKYILCAVDKDVLNSVDGTNFNYYESAKYNIEMRWVDIDRYNSLIWRYLQTLMGDKIDNIIGLKGIGPKKAEKILDGYYSHKELWDAVVKAYEARGRTAEEALTNLNLVDMSLLKEVNGELKIQLRTLEELNNE